MIIVCKECKQNISDKAISCPYCGFPIREGKAHTPRRKNTRRLRLPNGFGQISRIKGRNLRKPWRAMVTVGKNEVGKPICKLLQPIAYFETYNEAYTALLEYNKNPYYMTDDITVKELHERWLKEYLKKPKAGSTVYNENLAWRYSAGLHDMKVSELRPRHIRWCINNATLEIDGEIRKPTAHGKVHIRQLYNMMFDYAVEYEMVEKNHARDYKLAYDVLEEVNTTQREHMVYSEEEIKTLWKNTCDDYVDILLIQCYSGWRPGELCDLRVEDVDLENMVFIGGSKTEAGQRRVVPIHYLIEKFVRRYHSIAMNLNSEYLFNVNIHSPKCRKMGYSHLHNGYKKLIEDLKLDARHRPHDGRKHFISLAKHYKLDEYAIKRIVGHNINDLTEKVYTERNVQWLHEEMKKIKDIV